MKVSYENLSPVLSRYFERDFVRGDGHYIYSSNGDRYLDFVCGIATTTLGHRHPAVTAAIIEQADRLLHLCNAVGYVDVVGRLASRLVEAVPKPLDTVLFMNSGSESIEAALKLARRVTGRPGVISFRGGFHGRTFGAVSVTATSINYRRGYEPLMPAVYHAPFPNIFEYGGESAATSAAIRGLEDLFEFEIAPEDVAAIVIEAEQGEGGYRPAPAEFLKKLRAICDANGILLIADEVQCGYGRTGRMWGFDHGDIVPDAMCIAKSIANGLPLSALVTRRELQESWGRGAHGSTFGGNPVSCAAALAVLETIETENLVANAAIRGGELRAGLDELATSDAGIGDVRGRGLMVGVEFVRDPETNTPDGERCLRVVNRCAELGLLVVTGGLHHQVVRFIPPLNVTSEEIDTAVDLFGRAVKETA
jgi:4-aminobutyrate aminotransferase